MRLSYLRSASDVYAWARQLVDELNRQPGFADLPVYSDDAAAAQRVAIGDGYVTPDGLVRRRMA